MAARTAIPFRCQLKVYDRTIQVLKAAVQKAKLGQSEELAAIKRLDEQARRLERHVRGPSVEALFADERARSFRYGGRSVWSDRRQWDSVPRGKLRPMKLATRPDDAALAI